MSNKLVNIKVLFSVLKFVRSVENFVDYVVLVLELRP